MNLFPDLPNPLLSVRALPRGRLRRRCWRLGTGFGPRLGSLRQARPHPLPAQPGERRSRKQQRPVDRRLPQRYRSSFCSLLGRGLSFRSWSCLPKSFSLMVVSQWPINPRQSLNLNLNLERLHGPQFLPISETICRLTSNKGLFACSRGYPHLLVCSAWLRRWK